MSEQPLKRSPLTLTLSPEDGGEGTGNETELNSVIFLFIRAHLCDPWSNFFL